MVRFTAMEYSSRNFFATLSTSFSAVGGQHRDEMTSEGNKLGGWRGMVKKGTGEREGYRLRDWQPDGSLQRGGGSL